MIGGSHLITKAAAIAAVVMLLALSGPHAAAADPSTDSLRLVSQTSWVSAAPPNNVFDLRFVPQVSEPTEDVNLDINVDAVLPDRSEFDRSLSPDYPGYIVGQPIRAALSTFTPDADGAIDIQISVGDQVGQLDLSTAGVYPVSVELRPAGGGAPLAGFVTHLIYTPAAIRGPKLDVVWIVPVHAPPGDPRTPAGSVTPDQAGQLAAIANALAAYPTVPVTLRPTPDTIAGLEAVDPATVTRLSESLVGREVLADTWVPTSIAAMLDDGLNDEASLSLTRGGDALSADLRTQIAGHTWVQEEPIDQAALTFLSFAQFDRVILPEVDLNTNPSRITPAQPFEVAASDQTFIKAAVADSGLAAHFTEQPDPVLGAHQLLADLAQIYADDPAITRGVVIDTPALWTPSAAFLDTFLQGLAESPILQGATADSFFDNVPAATRDGEPLIRQVVTDTNTISSEAANLLPDAQRAAQRQLDALATSLPDTSKVYPRLERLLLEVPSDDLTPAGRQARLDALAGGIHAVTALVQLPGSRTVTFTARKGQLPITVSSASDEPLRVLLQVQSDKLEIPGASVTGTATYDLTLHKGNNLVVLTVVARTSGAFPLHLTVLSQDGNLIITKSSFTIQSTALSGVGVVLSVGAALFLVVWWARHAWRARKSNRTLEVASP